MSKDSTPVTALCKLKHMQKAAIPVLRFCSFLIRRPFYAVSLTSVMIVAAFPPYDLYPFIWFALVPWLFVHSDISSKFDHPSNSSEINLKRNLWTVVKHGFLNSFWMTVLGFFWVAYVIVQYGGLPWPVGIVGLLLFGFICQLQFPAYALLRYFVFNRFSQNILFFPTLAALTYTGIDFIIPRLFSDSLGHSLHSTHYLKQLAEVLGVPGLTFLVLLSNESLTALLFSYFNHKSKAKPFSVKKALAVFAVVTILFYSTSIYLRQVIDNRLASNNTMIHAVTVQANIGDFDKVAAKHGARMASQYIVDKYLSMSKDALDKFPDTELLVWPETSYSTTFRTPPSFEALNRERMIDTFVKERQVPLIFGGYDREHGKEYNALYSLSSVPLIENPVTRINSLGKDINTYRKSVLLPFGEYIPFGETFPIIKKWFPQVGFFGPGSGASAMPLPLKADLTGSKFKFSPAICYEILFSDFILDSVRKGADVIVNITNDSWFGHWAEPELHIALSTFRAIETRRSVIRSTNTGITSLILPNGELVGRTAYGTEDLLKMDVPILDHSGYKDTILLQYGNVFGYIALSLSFIITFVSLFLYFRKRYEFKKSN